MPSIVCVEKLWKKLFAKLFMWMIYIAFEMKLELKCTIKQDSLSTEWPQHSQGLKLRTETRTYSWEMMNHTTLFCGIILWLSHHNLHSISRMSYFHILLVRYGSPPPYGAGHYFDFVLKCHPQQWLPRSLPHAHFQTVESTLYMPEFDYCHWWPVYIIWPT